MEPEVPGSAIHSSGHRGNNREFVVAFQQKIPAATGFQRGTAEARCPSVTQPVA